MALDRHTKSMELLRDTSLTLSPSPLLIIFDSGFNLVQRLSSCEINRSLGSTHSECNRMIILIERGQEGQRIICTR